MPPSALDAALDPLDTALDAGTDPGSALTQSNAETLRTARSLMPADVGTALTAAQTRQQEAAQQKRAILQAARQRLLDDHGDNTQALLSLGAGLLAPTRTGSFGESLGNAAGFLVPAVARQEDLRRRRQEQALGLETAEAEDLEREADRAYQGMLHRYGLGRQLLGDVARSEDRRQAIRQRAEDLAANRDLRRDIASQNAALRREAMESRRDAAKGRQFSKDVTLTADEAAAIPGAKEGVNALLYDQDGKVIRALGVPAAKPKEDAGKWEVRTDAEHPDPDDPTKMIPAQEYRYNATTGEARTLVGDERYIPSRSVKTGSATLNLAGGRESVFNQRVIQAANQASKDLENVVKLPIESSSGFLAGRKQGAGLLSAGKEVLANTMTGQDAQTYNAMAAGFQRTLAGIEASGLMPSGSLTHQMDAVIFKEGDTNLTKLHKLAQTRQIIEAGLEVVATNPRVSKDEKEKAKEILARVEKAVPFTHSDLIKLHAAQQENPKATLQDIMPKVDAAPKIGEVRKGYRFKGGDPADKASWEKAE